MSDDDAGRTRPLDPADYSRFSLRDRREIVPLLRTLIERRALVTTYLEDKLSFLTLLVALAPEDDAVILDAPPRSNAGDTAPLPGPDAVCVTRLDNVRIQFSLAGLAAGVHDGRPVLRAPLPETVIRVQRREFFRLSPPQTTPLTCTIFIGESGARRTVQARILDISGGGLAVVVPPENVDFSPGTGFDDCRLALPDGDVLPVRLRVRNLFDIELPTGRRLRRAGCEFVGLANAVTARLQRYIFRLERDLNARRAEL